MNKGLKASNGEIIGILNADDWYEKRTIEKVGKIFSTNSNLSLVHGAMRIWDKNKDVIKTYGPKQGFNEALLAPYHHPTCFFHRQVYERIGLYDQQFSTAADYDFMLRFKRCNFEEFYVDEVLTNFRAVGVTSQSRMFPSVQIWKLLKKNKYSFYRRIQAIVFRGIRTITVITINFLGLSQVKKFVRKLLSYHKS
jgi:hypothetical protein